MSRREFSGKVRTAAFERSKGRCEECSTKLYVGKYHYDHIIPDAFDGEPTLENCAVLCLNCHGKKTAEQDVPSIAKSNRNRVKATQGKRPWRGGGLSGDRIHKSQARGVFIDRATGLPVERQEI